MEFCSLFVIESILASSLSCNIKISITQVLVPSLNLHFAGLHYDLQKNILILESEERGADTLQFDSLLLLLTLQIIY